MTQRQRFDESTSTPARLLFKADHPRGIDRHIEFFGDRDAAARDMCGEALLDALTRGSEDEVPSCA